MADTLPDLDELDRDDPLAWTRGEFEIPQARACGAEADGEALYFCGNSLGLLSKQGRKHMIEELDVWSTRWVGDAAHHSGSLPFESVYVPYERTLTLAARSLDISPILILGPGNTSMRLLHPTWPNSSEQKKKR